MDRLLAMRVFVEVADAGSFTRAADRLDVSTTAASRHVAQLEEHLGARLLQRNTRRLSLTEAGRAYLDRARQILDDLAEAEAEAGLGASSPRGLLRVTMPLDLGARHVAPAVAEFRRRHPDLSLEMDLSDRRVDLVEEGYDLGLRLSRQLPQDLVARRLCGVRMVLCAAPAYLAARGLPGSVEDLAAHDCLSYTLAQQAGVWRLSGPAGEVSFPVSGPLTATNGRALAAAAVAGMGIILEPTFIVGDALRAGELVPVLPDWRGPTLDLYAVYPSRRHLSAKTRAFVEFMQETIGDPPPWEEGL